MNAVSQLHFLRPLWLLALLVLPLLAWWWRQRRGTQTAWRRHVDPHLLPHLLETTGQRARGTGIVWMLVLLLAVLALAGPAWRLGEAPLWRSQRPLVVALDLSSAMLASDLPPSRLLQARAKLATLLRERDGGQVGLVAFADDAYTVAPLTDDTSNIVLFLDALEPDVMPVDGHRADRAIAWSARLLQQAGFDHGDILLITDHASGDARSAAEAAVRAGFRVSVLGVGTPSGAPYRNREGGVVHARLDATALSSLARVGDGSYAAMLGSDADLRALGVLSAAQADSEAAGDEGGRSWRDEGYWLLPPLMLLALFAFRRGTGAAVVVLIALLPWPQASAQTTGTWWRRADQVAHARMEAGEQAYRAGDYARAAQQYEDLQNADAQYNLGNALAQQGDYAHAIEAYDRALRMQPGMADAIANRRAVQAAMQRKPPPGKGSRQQRGQGGQQPPSQPQSGSRPSQAQPRAPGQRAADATAQPPTSTQHQQAQPRDAQRPSPDKRADAAAQRAADAAQRARMQRALQARGASAGSTRAPGKTEMETSAQREQRLANEAWLRRVPDDPGGLLRAKFRLEYERRQQEGGQ